MLRGALGRAFSRRPAARPLVPGPFRRAAAALLAACVVLTAAVGVRFAGYRLPGWLDSALGPPIQARLGRFPVLLNWLPDIGTLVPVAMMTLALVLACALTLDILATRRRGPAGQPPPAG